MKRAFYSLAVLLLLSAPMLARPSTSDSTIKSYLDYAQQRALARAALRSHGIGTDTGRGPQVDLTIAFPRSQTGIENIMTVDLMPRAAGAHPAESIAVQRGGTVLAASFQPVKDLRHGVAYDVIAIDSRSDKYLVGRITIGNGGDQHFTIAAPLLGANSTPYRPPSPSQASAGNVLEPWMIGVRGIDITPQLLQAAGYPNLALRGIVVADVVNGMAAQRAGLRDGDIIIIVNGLRVATMRQLLALTVNRRQGAPTTLGYIRGGRLFSIAVPVSTARSTEWRPPVVGPGYVRPTSPP